MVSWKEAFRGALTTLLMSVAWIAVGLGIIIGAGLLGGVRVATGPSGGGYLQPEPLIMIPATSVGAFIIGLGWMAALYKMQRELVAGEVKGPAEPAARRQQTVICRSCGAENLPNSKFCINCGARMD